VSRLTALIAQAKVADPQVGADLEREFKPLSSRLPFGANLECHHPEAVELPLRPVRKGDHLRMLPPRGSTENGDQRLWQVAKMGSKGNSKIADLWPLGPTSSEAPTVAPEDVAVIAELKDTIHPGLSNRGRVERGGDKPYHSVTNASCAVLASAGTGSLFLPSANPSR
jgi:adenine-specific DNA-methyltransferase